MRAPGAGDADSSLIEYPVAEPFTNAQGIGASAEWATYVDASATLASKPRIPIETYPFNSSSNVLFPAYSSECSNADIPHPPNKPCDFNWQAHCSQDRHSQ